MSENITVEKFRETVLKRFDFLKSKGFRREKLFESTTPTSSTIVFLGNNVGFVFSFDVRDQCFDSEVVRVKNNQIIRNSDGGYSSDIFTHLVRHQGYRGSPSGMRKNKFTIENDDENSMEQMINSCINLLRDAGQILLDDKPNSIP